MATNHHSAAISETGDLYFWGTGVFGTFYEPQLVQGNMMDVEIGGSFGIAKDIDGMLWSWGQNEFGELGQNDTKARLYPNLIGSLKRKAVNRVACGGSFAILIGVDRSAELRRPEPSPLLQESQ